MSKIKKEALFETAKKYKYNANEGEFIGEHNGAHFFTIGQRKGLNLGGFKEPYLLLIQIFGKTLFMWVRENLIPDYTGRL